MHPGEDVLNEYVDGALAPEALRGVQQHLDGCESCRAVVMELGAVKRAAIEVRHYTIDPPPLVWWRIQNRINRNRRWSIADRQLRLANAALLVLAVGGAAFVGGLAIGRRTAAARPEPELASLRQEVREMRQMVTLSLLQQQSASERLNGVMWTRQIDNPGSEIVSALLDTLMHDPNVNVRLATIEALRRFTSNDTVRRGAVDALDRQTSPLVQIALIDFLVESPGAAPADVLRRLSENPTADGAVRAHAIRALQRIG